MNLQFQPLQFIILAAEQYLTNRTITYHQQSYFLKTTERLLAPLDGAIFLCYSISVRSE